MVKTPKFHNPVRIAEIKKEKKEIPAELKERRIRRNRFNQTKDNISTLMTDMTLYSLAFNSGLNQAQETVNSFLGNSSVTIIDKEGQKAIDNDISFFIRVAFCIEFATSFLSMNKQQALDYALKYVEDITTSDKKQEMLKMLKRSQKPQQDYLTTLTRSISKQPPESPFIDSKRDRK